MMSYHVYSFLAEASEGDGGEERNGRAKIYLGQVSEEPRQVVKCRLGIVSTFSTLIEQLNKLRNSQP